MIQVAAQVTGNDAAITLGGLGGYFELNTMLPLIARNLLESIMLLTNAARAFDEKCVQGLTLGQGGRISELVEKSLALATPLVPALGYDRAATIAKKAFATDRTVREVALETGWLDPDEIARLLDSA